MIHARVPASIKTRSISIRFVCNMGRYQSVAALQSAFDTILCQRKRSVSSIVLRLQTGVV